MYEFTRCNLTSLSLGLLLAIGCTYQTETTPELSPSVTLISAGNPTEVYPMSPAQQTEQLEQIKKYVCEQKRSTHR